MALHEIGKGITSGSVMKDMADSDGTEAVGAAGGAGGSDGNKGASAQTGSKQKTAAQSVASDSK